MNTQKKVKSTLLFYASSYNKTESGIKLNLNGEYCCTLLPDTWTTVNLPSNIKIVQATFNTANKDETKIEIFNIKGQRVDVLSCHAEPVEVRQEVIWNADKFSSGIYFVKLNIPDSPIKKMVLIK